MKKLFKALADFQQEVPIIHKGTEGYGYSYADLPAIFPIINPLLKKHGLGFTQLGTGTGIKTIIFHCESGEHLESHFDIPQNVSLAKMNDFQVLGAGVTYLRRYALSGALGLVTDKDTDAGGQQVKKEEKPEKPWFNPADKQGFANEIGKNWIEYAKKTSRAEAIKATEKKYILSKKVREFLNTVILN